ncbi:MAG: hypothetical protein H6R26_1266 [Proteobacteria bacterium]|nr:hypothetical protein [Pseudomonadota bacterium]
MPLVALCLLMVLSGLLLWNSSHLLARFEPGATRVGGDSDKIRLYSQQLASLQERMTGFIADSVETRLRALERNVAAGTVGAAEIKAFEDLRNELKLLESYTSGKDRFLIEPSLRDHPRFQMTPGSSQTISKGELFGEVVELKNLTYFSIASCGLVACMIGGYWWQQNARAKRLEYALSRRALLMHGSVEPNEP